MSYCPECGSEVANNDTFCAYCGISLQVVSESPVSENPQPENAPILGEPEKIQTSASLDKEKPDEIVEPKISAPVAPPTPFILEDSAGTAPAEIVDEVEESAEVPQSEISFQPPTTVEQLNEKTADYEIPLDKEPVAEEVATPVIAEPIEEPVAEVETKADAAVSEISREIPEKIETIDEFSQTIPYSPSDYTEQNLVSPIDEEDKLKSVLDEIDNNLQAENNFAVPTPIEPVEEKVEPIPPTPFAEEKAVSGELPVVESVKLEEPKELEPEVATNETPMQESPVYQAIEATPVIETPVSEAIQEPPTVEETPVSEVNPVLVETPKVEEASVEKAVSENIDEKDGRSFTNPNMGYGDTDGRNKQKLKPLDEGTVLNNRYEIIRKIGGGGMGAVYLANDRNLGGVLRAVKEMVQSYIEDEAQEKAVSDFKRESLLLTSLEHSGIPTIYDYFFDEKEGRFYLVMKYISGGDLAARLRSAPEGRIDEVSVTDWAIQIADVLDYLHNRQPPIVYRDLKPSNIMIDGNTGKVMIIDFGIARWVNKEEKGVTAVGTMGYAPPELFSGNVEPRSDIYSLGSTMFHLLTGADPQSNPLLIFDFNKNPRPRQINPNLSDQMEQILMRSVEYNSEQRFKSAAEMRDELVKHLQNLRKNAVSFGVLNATGAGQSLSNVPVFCGFCGQKIVATDMFCPFCGAQQPLLAQSQKLQPTPINIPVKVTARLLVVGTNELEQTEYTLEKETNLLGRRDPMSNIFPEVDMSKYDPQTKISRKHAKIWREGDLFMLEDLGSSNGTTLIMNSNESIRLLPHQPHVLSHGDKVRVGDTTLRFTIG